MCNGQAISVNIRFGEYTIANTNLIVVVFTSPVYYNNPIINENVLNRIHNINLNNLPLLFVIINLENIEVEFSNRIDNEEQIREYCINQVVEYWRNCPLEQNFSFDYYQY